MDASTSCAAACLIQCGTFIYFPATTSSVASSLVVIQSFARIGQGVHDPQSQVPTSNTSNRSYVKQLTPSSTWPEFRTEAHLRMYTGLKACMVMNIPPGEPSGYISFANLQN